MDHPDLGSVTVSTLAKHYGCSEPHFMRTVYDCGYWEDVDVHFTRRIKEDMILQNTVTDMRVEVIRTDPNMVWYRCLESGAVGSIERSRLRAYWQEVE